MPASKINYHRIIVQLTLPYCSAAYMMDTLRQQVKEFLKKYKAMVRKFVYISHFVLCNVEPKVYKVLSYIG